MKEKILNSKRILCTNNLIKNLRGTSWFVETHVMLLIITLNQYLSTPLFKKRDPSSCNVYVELLQEHPLFNPPGLEERCLVLWPGWYERRVHIL